MGTVRWTDEAINWLVEIYDYIARDSPAAAQRVVDGIAAKAGILALFPEAGHRLEHPTGRHVRILLYGHYRIAYIVGPDRDVDIVGIYHTALDIERHLRIR